MNTEYKVGTLSPNRRLIQSSSMKAKVSIVVSFWALLWSPRARVATMSPHIPESCSHYCQQTYTSGTHCCRRAQQQSEVLQKKGAVVLRNKWQILWSKNQIYKQYILQTIYLKYLNYRNTFVLFIYLENIKDILCEIEEGNWFWLHLKLPSDISVTVNFRLR